MLVYYVTNYEIARNILTKSGKIEAKTPLEPRGKVIRMYQQKPPATFKRFAMPSEAFGKGAAEFVTKADSVDVYMEFESTEVGASRRRRGEWVVDRPIRIYEPAASAAPEEPPPGPSSGAAAAGQTLIRAVYA